MSDISYVDDEDIYTYAFRMMQEEMDRAIKEVKTRFDKAIDDLDRLHDELEKYRPLRRNEQQE